MNRFRGLFEKLIISILRISHNWVSGEGDVSLRTNLDGVRANILVGKGAKVRRDAWLSCKDEKSIIEIGEGTGINPYVKIRVQNSGFVKIGKNCSIHSFTVIYGDGGVTIGDKVRIATHVVIVPNDHNFDNLNQDIYEQGLTRKEITIGDDVWIGAGAIILAGVKIGSHSVIAAGAVVTKDVEENTIVGGVPAKVLRKRGKN